jgi:hypothetical protein
VEELLPEDNEKMQFLDDSPLAANELQGFAPNEMVRCETCLRANPPTRANCLYCAAALPAGKRIMDQRAITLKPLEDSAAGYNCIYLPSKTHHPATDNVAGAAQLLKLRAADLERIIEANLPLPLARTATREESELVSSKLEALGFKTIVASDHDLGMAESAVVQIRSASMADEQVVLRQMGGDEGISILWSQISLVVSGRLISKRTESAEQKSRRGEREIISASEFFTDESVMDIYGANRSEAFRISANSFDFSCLPQRSLIAAENFVTLRDWVRSRAFVAHQDDSYLSLRQTLDLVWPSAQRTGSGGWRRERPGKFSIEAVTESSNLNQFTRYSRLQWFRLQHPTLEDGVVDND